MLDEIETILEHSHCISLAQLAQQAQDLTVVWRTTKNLALRSYKIMRVQVIEKGSYKRWTRFSDWFLQAICDIVLDPKLTYFTDEAGFHLSGCISAEYCRYRAVLIWEQTFEVPLHSQRTGVWCATTTWIIGPIFLKTLLIQSGMSVTFFGLFLRARQSVFK
jgi:hypothetical protein